MHPRKFIRKLPQLLVPLRTIQKVCCQIFCLGDKIIFSGNGLMATFIFVQISLPTLDAPTLSPLCINHTPALIYERTENFWAAPSATHEPQISLRSNHVRAIIKLVKISYNFVDFQSLDRAKAIATTNFLDQLVSMNCNERAWYLFPFSSVPPLFRDRAKGFPMAWWYFCNMMNFKKRTKTSKYALTQDFNNLSVKFGAFVPADNVLPHACGVVVQMGPQW